MQAALLFLLFSFLIILGILISMLYVVRQQCSRGESFGQ